MSGNAPHTLPIRVYYEDTDVGGVVYYANYLKFMERGRTEFLRRLGFHQRLLQSETHCQFVVRSVAMDLHRPAHLDDLLQLETEVVHCGRASLRFHQRVMRHNTAQGNVVSDKTIQAPVLLCAATIRIACVDTLSFRPIAIPAILAAQLVDIAGAATAANPATVRK